MSCALSNRTFYRWTALVVAVLAASCGSAVADGVAVRQAEYLNDYYNDFKNSNDLGIDADVTINVALGAFSLNKPQGEINAANAALSQYFTGKENYWNGQTADPAAIDGYWATRTIASVLMDPDLKQHVTSDNQAKMKAYLFNFAQNRDKLDKSSVDTGLRGRIYDSDNHDMHSRMVYWGTAQILKDDPAYKDVIVTGGQTVEQRYGEWTTNLLDYFQNRAGKGGTVEVDSTVYSATYHSPVFNIAEYAEDPRLKEISREYLTLHMADLAQKTTEGISGGAKSRAAKDRVQTPGEHRSVQYLYLFAGQPDEGMNMGVVPGGAQLERILGGATATDYRLPQEIIDMIADEDVRGSYTYTTNRMGEGTVTTAFGRPMSIPTDGQSSLVHTTRVTPEFTLGWFTTDENKNYMAISGQSQAFFALTDASPTSRLVMNLTGGTANDELQGVGDGNAMMFRRQIGNHDGQTPRVYISDDFTYGAEADGWVFGSDNSGSYFAIKGVLPTNGSTVSHSILDIGSDGGPGNYLTYSNDDTVVIVQMGQASEYNDLAAFKADIRDNSLTFNSGSVIYNPGAAGAALRMYNTRTLPRVNGQTVDLTPAKTYDSPYLNGDYGDNTVTFTGLSGNSFDLNFNYNPVAPTQQRYVPSNTTLSGEVFSPGFREMVGVTELSSDSASPLSYAIGPTAVMQIDFDGFHNVMDTLIVNGGLHLGGQLLVNMIRESPTSAGVFQVFDAESISGSFDTITLPSAGPGLVWNTDSLGINGTLKLFQLPSLVLGDTNTTYNASSPDDNPPVDAAFQADIAAISPNWVFKGLDEGGSNDVRAMTFSFDAPDGNELESVTIQARVRGLSGFENDSMALDSASNRRQISDMPGYNPAGGWMTLEYEFAPSEFTLLSDGQLNLAFFDDTLVDWVGLSWIFAIEPDVLAGDYNNDGFVDAADYSVWRDHLGAPEGTLLNDTDGGIIGSAQYTTWRSNFGASSAPASIASSNVPESSSVALLLSSLMVIGFRSMARHTVRKCRRSFYLCLAMATLFGYGVAPGRAEEASAVALVHREPSIKPSSGDLATCWSEPPRAAGVRCWWWWLNGNVTKAAITKDLEAMQGKGFSGAVIVDADGAGQKGNERVPEGPMFGADEWTDLYLHALSEAKRLGLTLGLSIQSGWNLGGPHVQLEDAAKELTWAETQIEGARQIALHLPQPEHNFNYYRDIRVLAWPDRSQGEQRKPIRDLTDKTASKELGPSAPDCRYLLEDDPDVDGEQDALLDEIVDLTDKVDEDGVLNWKAPAGRWVILRIGFTPTVAEVSTSSGKWQGHVIDYMSRAAFDTYWYETVHPLLKEAGDMTGTVLTHLGTDSWECGGMNWTPQFEEEFRQFNGYDIARYLPVVAGKIIDNRAASNAFLADFRKTIAHCISENHYRVFAARAAEYGLGTQPECSGPHAGPLDGITNYSHSDIVMSEFWAPSPHRPNPPNRFFVKQASSAAHIYGKRYVGAESFTTIGPHWNDLLWRGQKSAMDFEFCEGLNMVFFHTFTCSPQEMGLPGQEYFAGTHINPQVTWWNESGPFIDYINRVQRLVQQGTFVADVLYYYGDHVPNIAVNKSFNRSGALPGYDYDVTNEEVLLQLHVEDGRVVAPSGLKYRLLVLPDHKVLSLAALVKVDELLSEGATVLGPKPERLVSRVGGDAAQHRFHALADHLWGEKSGAQGARRVGSGRLIWGQTSREFLQTDGVALDFESLDGESQAAYEYIHYVLDGADVYFVCNQTDVARSANLAFRVTDRQPEFWNPASGSIRDASQYTINDDTTTVPMSFEPHGSMFVVFRDSADGSRYEGPNFPSWQEKQTISGPWEVSFNPRWGGPKQPVRFEQLTSWSDHDDPGIRHYSGRAVYRATFTLDEVNAKEPLAIELGDVRDVGIARVILNDSDFGVMWLPPFRIDISQAVNRGDNRLEVHVVNSWHNRVKGDDALSEEKRLTRTNVKVQKDGAFEWKLEDSGLLGPVKIVGAVDETDYYNGLKTKE